MHNASRFAEGPFLAVKCAGIPRDLIESELFGYVAGAFAGASKTGRLGKFELASGGTLFLDEIGDLPIDVQAKMLRVLQERTIVRVGGYQNIPISCRFIAATSRNLSLAAEQGGFRRDLLYRINVITLEVPALRDRIQDLPVLVEYFVEHWNAELGKAVRGVDPRLLAILSAYDWPGNVREVENVVERAMALAKGEWIRQEDVPGHLIGFPDYVDAQGQADSPVSVAQQHCEESLQRLYTEALRSENGNVLRAAQLLGMSRATFYRKLKKHGLSNDVAIMRLYCHI